MTVSEAAVSGPPTVLTRRMLEGDILGGARFAFPPIRTLRRGAAVGVPAGDLNASRAPFRARDWLCDIGRNFGHRWSSPTKFG